MKQQINNLINGSKNVIRMEDAAKYTNAKQATSHIGYAGTSRDERSRIASIVAEQNPDTMTVVLDGNTIVLQHDQSLSGKTQWWKAEISEDIAAKYIFTDGILKSYYLRIDDDCTVYVDKFVRKSESQQWKHSYTQAIDEAWIEIL